MNCTLATALVALSLPLSTAAAATADRPGDPPTAPEFFPPHTYFYLQLNPFSTVDGFKKLQLAKLLEDPMLRALLDQGLKSIPPQADPRGYLARYPFDRAIGQSIAVGVVGFRASTRGSAEIEARQYEFPGDGALPADLFRQRIRFETDNLLAIEIADEDLFRNTLAQLLGDTLFRGEPPTPTTQDVKGTEIQAWAIPGIGGEGKIYSAFVRGYFLASQSRSTLIAAMHRQEKRSASLNTRSDFSRFASHRGEKSTAAILHVGLDSAIDLFSPMIPRPDREEIAMWGGFDFSGLQLGMGFHEGGICEWFHLAFAENPQGILMNLSRLWPSAGYTEVQTSRGTVYAASLTLDWAALYGATTFLLDLCDVDTKAFADETSASLGLDLREDLMGALGNTLGVVAVIPKIGFIPELSFALEVRNRAKMEKVLNHVKALCRAGGIPTKDFTVSGSGPKATYLNLGADLRIKPAFVLRGDKLVVSLMPMMLKYAVRKTRTSGLAVVDYLPGAKTKMEPEPMMRYFVDPAPTAINLYADLLKIIDSSGQRLPFELTDLPSPEFVGGALSRFGVEFSMNPYFVSLDLHSPTGIAIPLVVGASVAMQMQQQQQRRSRPAVGVGTVH